jgi:hypothetical protein
MRLICRVRHASKADGTPKSAMKCKMKSAKCKMAIQNGKTGDLLTRTILNFELQL